MSVKVRAPILRRCALSFEKAISIGFRSGLYKVRFVCVALALNGTFDWKHASLWVTSVQR